MDFHTLFVVYIKLLFLCQTLRVDLFVVVILLSLEIYSIIQYKTFDPSQFLLDQ